MVYQSGLLKNRTVYLDEYGLFAQTMEETMLYDIQSHGKQIFSGAQVFFSHTVDGQDAVRIILSEGNEVSFTGTVRHFFNGRVFVSGIPGSFELVPVRTPGGRS